MSIDKIGKYDAGNGNEAQVGDIVFVSGVPQDYPDYGMTGQILGFTGAVVKQISLVMLEKPAENGATVVCWPTVCLTKIGNETPIDLQTVKMLIQDSFLYRDMTK